MSNQCPTRAGMKPPPPPRPPASPTSSDQTLFSTHRQRSMTWPYSHGPGIPSSQSLSNGTTTHAQQLPSQQVLSQPTHLTVQHQAAQQPQHTHSRPMPPRYLPQQAPVPHAPQVHGAPIAPAAVPVVFQPPPPPLTLPHAARHSELQHPLSGSSGRGPAAGTTCCSRPGISSTAFQQIPPTMWLPPPVSSALQQRLASGQTATAGSAGVAVVVQCNVQVPPPPPPRDVPAAAAQSAVQPPQLSWAQPAPPPPRLSAGTAGNGAPTAAAATAAAAGGSQSWVSLPPPAAPAARASAAPASENHIGRSQLAPSAAAAAAVPPAPAPPAPARPSDPTAAAQAAPAQMQYEEDVYSGPLAPWMLWYQHGLQRAIDELILDPHTRHQLTGVVRRYGYGDWLLRQLSQHVQELKQRTLQAITAGSSAGGNDVVDSIWEFEDLIIRAQAEGPPAAPAQLPGRPGYASTIQSSSTRTMQQQQQAQQPYQQRHQHQGVSSSGLGVVGSSDRNYDNGGSLSVPAGAATAHSVEYGASSSNGSTANGRVSLDQEAAAGAAGRTVLDDAADTRQQLACIICLDAPRSVLLLPCKHLVLCASCAAELQEKAMTSREWRSVVRAQPVCPVCREVVTSQIEGVYL